MQRNKDRKLDGRMIALFALSLILVAAAAAIVFADTDANAGNSDDSVNYIPPKPHPSPDDDEEEPTWPLICGDGVKCVYGDFTLTLYKEGNGTGRMFDYDFSLSRGVTEAPWGKIYKHIEKVVVKEGVTYIGEEAFFGCKNIKTVKLTDPVSIGRYAFQGCSSLGSVDLSNVTGVGEYAFSCTNLKHISLPNAKFIGKYAFPESATFVIIGNEVWVGMDYRPFGDLEFYTSDGERIYESNESFRGHMYYRAGDSKMKVLNTCGNGIEFWIDENKHEMKIYERGDSDGEIRFDMDLMGNLAEPIRSVVIEEGIRSIGNNAFKGFASLESISLPSSMRSIGAGAFAECTQLKSIAIPNIATVGSNAFKGCVSLTEISIMHACVAADAFPNHRFCLKNGDNVNPDEKNFLGHTFKGQSIAEMDEYSIRGICGSGVVYEFAHSTGELSIFRFETGSGHMENFTNVCPWDSVKDLIKSVKICDGVLSICDRAFKDCVSLTDVEIGHDVRFIGNNAFNCCKSLKQISLPNGIKSIENDTFTECIKLESVIIPDSVKFIGNYAFHLCVSLKSIEIPGSVKFIGSNAFENCTSLCYINIGCGVEGIAADAFPDHIFWKNDEKQLIATSDRYFPWHEYRGETIDKMIVQDENGWCGDRTAFHFRYSTGEMHIDSCGGSREMYPSFAPGYRKWEPIRDLIKSVKIIDIKNIGNYAFADCESLVSVVLYGDAVSIGKNSFDNCKSLKDVKLPNSIKRIGSDAFIGCESLETIDLPSDLRIVNSHAFSGCTSLKSITIPDKVEYIGHDAFSGCTSLKSIEIPGSVKYIGKNAFGKCTSLCYISVGYGVEDVAANAFPDHKFSLNGVTITPDNQHFAGHTYEGASIKEMAAIDANDGITFDAGCAYILLNPSVTQEPVCSAIKAEN